MKRLGYLVKSVTVLNDTVAALLAGAGSQAGQYDNYIGLIAGTGFNIALFAPVKAHNKLGALNFQSEQMALNLEAGNFTPSHLSKWDEALDKVMPPLHGQRLEKAIAGFYLPYIYEAVCPQATDFDPALGTGQLVHLRDHGDSLAAQVILERSSALLAAVLAGALKVTAARNCCIIAEGTRYWADPLQDKQVRRYLKELIPSELNFDIIKIADANLIGSACAALR